MPRRYRLLTGLTAIGGSFALVITGELNPVFYPFIFLSLIGYRRLLKGAPQAPKIIIGLSSVAGLFIFLFDAFILTGDYLVSVAHLSLIFHAIKSFDIKDPYDPLQVYFMTLLQLVIASEFTVAMLFGIVMILFIIMFIIVMNMAHYIKETQDTKWGPSFTPKNLRFFGGPIPSLILLTIILSAVFFVSLPRLKYGLWGKSHVKGIKNAGFSERMALSEGELKLDPSVVARIELRPLLRGPYYLRGNVLDYFDGKEWVNTFKHREPILRKGEEFIIRYYPQGKDMSIGPAEIILWDILLEPIESDIIFVPEEPLSLTTTASRVERDYSDTLYIPRKGARRIHYLVKKGLKEGDSRMIESIGPELSSEYLQIPEDIKKELSNFVQKILKGTKGDLYKAKKIEVYLKENYRYSLKPPEVPEGMNPVSHFLFHSKTGYCEHFASAMVLLLRAEGIPARVVTGFAGGELNPVGNYIIMRQKDAHSWVEAWVEGRWQRFDPTPTETINPERPSILFLYIDYLKLKWQRYVVNFSRQDQLSIFSGIKDTLKNSGSFVLREIRSLYNTILKIYYRNFYSHHPILSGSPKNQRFFGVLLLFIASILVLAGMVFIFLLVRSIKKNRIGVQDRSSRYYLKLRKLLKKKGYPIKDSTTPNEIGMLVRTKHPQAETALYEFINLYEKARFSPRGVPKKSEIRLKELLRLLKESLK